MVRRVLFYIYFFFLKKISISLYLLEDSLFYGYRNTAVRSLLFCFLSFFFLFSWLVGFWRRDVEYRPPNQYIAPVQEPYGYIIFRASEVKDLSVDEPPPAQNQHNVHDDPAVLGVRSFFIFHFFFPSSYDEIISDVKTTIIRERKKKPCGIFRCLPSDFFFFLC